jgi:hypothetical protein
MSPAMLLAELPALPLHTAGKYVAAAYVVLFAMVLVYLAIIAVRTSRTERQLGELLEQLDREQAGGAHPAGGAPSRGSGTQESSA